MMPENLISAVSERTAVVAMPGPTSATNARWEGLSKRNSGIVLLKSRWDTGFLEFKEDTLRWADAHDASKNVLLTAKQITEQQLTCLKKPGGNDCFEWVVKTKGQEYRFRDIAWEQGENAKPQEVFKFMKTLFPYLISSQVPVDEK